MSDLVVNIGCFTAFLWAIYYVNLIEHVWGQSRSFARLWYVFMILLLSTLAFEPAYMPLIIPALFVERLWERFVHKAHPVGEKLRRK